MSQKARKCLFFIMMAVAFVAVTIYEFLTPLLSDDIAYMDDVSAANSFFDLFSQEYQHYISHTGRSVSHFILRIFLYIGSKPLFNIVAGLVFVTMTLLIYLNIDARKEYDVRLYGFVLALVWFFDAAIGDTVLWQDGACNYLFTGTIIMGFITLFRHGLKKQKNYGIAQSVGIFLFGVVAGWCNENTSGGLILFILIEIGYLLFKGNKNAVKPWMLAGIAGSLTGFGLLIAAPGNFGRLDVLEEEHTGLVAMAARFLKITNNLREHYLFLICALGVILVLLAYLSENKDKYTECIRPMILFGVLFVATAYALIMVPNSELRSYYGASIFLMIAVLNGLAVLAQSSEELIQGALSGILVVAAIVFVLAYFEDGANLARIKREFDERDAYFAEMESKEIQDISAPMLRPQWENRFTAAYRMDIAEDEGYWINTFYANHYHLGTVAGVDRETWTEY